MNITTDETSNAAMPEGIQTTCGNDLQEGSFGYGDWGDSDLFQLVHKVCT